MEQQAPIDESFPWATSESAFIEAVRAACHSHPELDENELCRQFDSEVLQLKSLESLRNYLIRLLTNASLRQIE
jgi:hypothetical protein